MPVPGHGPAERVPGRGLPVQTRLRGPEGAPVALQVTAELLCLLLSLVPPSIREDGRRANVSGMAGQSLTLECDASGFPAPEVVWLKNGQLVGLPWGSQAAGGTGVAGRRGRCLPGGTGAQRRGALWSRDEAVCWGGHGSVVSPTSSLGLSFLVADARRWPDPAHVLPLASSAQIPEVGSHQLLHGARELHFPSVQESDSGPYACRAENQAGAAQRDFHLRVLSE